MARLPALIDAFAACDPRGRATVVHVARVIREAGLIQTTKRGRGAAEMTEHDAVALLMGLNCSENIQDAPKAVLMFSELAPVQAAKGGSVPPVLLPVVKAPTLYSALEALLIAAPQIDAMLANSEELHRKTPKAIRGNVAEFGYEFWSRATFHLPDPTASIAVTWMENLAGPIRRDLHVSYRAPQSRRPVRRSREFDRDVTISVGLSTFLRLHAALWPEEALLRGTR